MELTNKKTILIFIDWFLPGYKAGGPIRSIANLTQKLDHNFLIVTSNTDHNSTSPYEGVEYNSWIQYSANTKVLYLSKENEKIETIRRIFEKEEFDYIYLNSLFSFKYSLLPLWIARKLNKQNQVILAPRGMLKSAALSIGSRKKKIFLTLSKAIGLFKDITWHATNQEEKTEIQNHFSSAKVKIAPNLIVAEKQTDEVLKKTKGKLQLVSISRVSPEKGIFEGVKYLNQTDPKNGKIRWDIYGTLQNKEYLKKCTDLAATIDHVEIQFKGEISHHLINNKIKEYHFFYLPTLGENFGHAIAESFLASRPVIISDKTPWQNLEEKKAGWNIPLKADEFSKILNLCTNMNNHDYTTLVEGAYKLGQEVANNKEALEMNNNLFHSQ